MNIEYLDHLTKNHNDFEIISYEVHCRQNACNEIREFQLNKTQLSRLGTDLKRSMEECCDCSVLVKRVKIIDSM